MNAHNESVTIANLYCAIGRKWNHSFLPLGTLYITAALEAAGINVLYKDYQLWCKGNPYNVKKIISFLQTPSRILGIGCMGTMLPFLLKALETIKGLDPDKTIVLGGTGATGVADQILKHFPTVNFIVNSEGEETAAELFSSLMNGGSVENIQGISYRKNGRVTTNSPRPSIKDIDRIRRPAYHKVELSRYKIISFITSRGCPFHCTFCYSAKLWKDYRRRSIGLVVDEIEEVTRRTGIKRISILDDTFVLSTRRVLEFCEEIRRREINVKWTCFGRVGQINETVLDALSQSGCVGIGFGIESGSNEVLKRINKDFTREEVIETIRMTSGYFSNIEMFFMYGFPFETRTHFNESVSLVEKLHSDLVLGKGIKARFSFNLLASVPCTPLTTEFNALKQRISLKKSGFYSHEDKLAMVKRPFYFFPSLNTKWLSEMLDSYPDIFSGFYMFENPDFKYKAAILKKRDKKYRGS